MDGYNNKVDCMTNNMDCRKMGDKYCIHNIQIHPFSNRGFLRCLVQLGYEFPVELRLQCSPNAPLNYPFRELHLSLHDEQKQLIMSSKNYLEIMLPADVSVRFWFGALRSSEEIPLRILRNTNIITAQIEFILESCD